MASGTPNSNVNHCIPPGEHKYLVEDEVVCFSEEVDFSGRDKFWDIFAVYVLHNLRHKLLLFAIAVNIVDLMHLYFNGYNKIIQY